LIELTLCPQNGNPHDERRLTLQAQLMGSMASKISMAMILCPHENEAYGKILWMLIDTCIAVFFSPILSS